MKNQLFSFLLIILSVKNIFSSQSRDYSKSTVTDLKACFKDIPLSLDCAEEEKVQELKALGDLGEFAAQLNHRVLDRTAVNSKLQELQSKYMLVRGRSDVDSTIRYSYLKEMRRLKEELEIIDEQEKSKAVDNTGMFTIRTALKPLKEVLEKVTEN